MLNRVALAVVVVLTAYAALMSSLSAMRSNQALEQVSRIGTCNTRILGRALTVLNARSAYTTAQSSANLALQKAQADLLRKSLAPTPLSAEEGAAALRRYFDALTQFVEAAEAAKDKSASTAYPDERDLARCISK